MATISERLAYVLSFDTAGAIRDVQKFGSAAEKNLGKADAKLDKLSGNLKKFGAGAVAFAGVAGVGLFKLAGGAAEAEANMAALEQVVGDVAAQQIGEWAEDSAEKVGLASREAVEATTQFAGLGKIIGESGPGLSDFSTNLVELAADFAAFKNVSPQQAIQDIQAAFAGSTEVMRKYNIFLDETTLKAALFRETGEKVTGTLTAEQRIIATNAELYRQGADMIGQWTRESGELAGQSAQLKANLTNLGDAVGKGVLPHVTSLVSVANDLAGGLARMSPATASTIGGLATFGTVIAGLGGGTALLASKMIDLRTTFTKLGRTGRVMVGVMAGVGVAMAAMALEAQNAAKHQREVSTAIENVARATTEELVTGFDHALRAFVALGQANPEEFFRNMAEENLGAALKIRDTALANEEFAAQLDQTGLSIAAMNELIDDEVVAQNEARAATDRHTDALEAGEKAAGAAEAQLGDTADASSELAEEMRFAALKAGDAEDALEDVEEQAEDTAEAVNILEEAFAGLKDELSDRRDYLDAQDGFDDVRDAALMSYAAAVEGSEDAEAKARDHERSVIDLKQKIIDYATEIGNVPPERLTRILALLDEGSVDAAEAALAELERDRQAFIQVRTIFLDSPQGGASNVIRHSEILSGGGQTTTTTTTGTTPTRASFTGTQFGNVVQQPTRIVNLNVGSLVAQDPEQIARYAVSLFNEGERL